MIAELAGQEKRAAADLIAEARTKEREKYARRYGEEIAESSIPLEY